MGVILVLFLHVFALFKIFIRVTVFVHESCVLYVGRTSRHHARNAHLKTHVTLPDVTPGHTDRGLPPSREKEQQQRHTLSLQLQPVSQLLLSPLSRLYHLSQDHLSPHHSLVL
jgi:hypothetical protein